MRATPLRTGIEEMKMRARQMFGNETASGPTVGSVDKAWDGGERQGEGGKFASSRSLTPDYSRPATPSFSHDIEVPYPHLFEVSMCARMGFHVRARARGCACALLCCDMLRCQTDTAQYILLPCVCLCLSCPLLLRLHPCRCPKWQVHRLLLRRLASTN